MRLSVLDQSTIVSGRSPDASIRESIALAKHCENLGYARYWLAEHHNSAAIAGTAPEVLIAAMRGHDERIRVGSAGVMLPHYAAFKVAEQFRVLEAIAPGRIDLGLGRAPGSDMRTAYALNPNADTAADRFPAQIRDLLAWLAGEKLAEGHPLPGRDRPSARAECAGGLDSRQLRLRGAGGGVLRTAVLLRPFHHRWTRHGAGARDLPAKLPAEPAPSRSVRRAHASGRWRRTPWRRRNGNSLPVRSGDWAATVEFTPRSPRPRRPPPTRTPMRIRRGSPRCVRAPFSARQTRWAASFVHSPSSTEVEEVAILTTVHDPEARRRSYRLLAAEFALDAEHVPPAAG